MGLILAAVNSVSGTLADQWKEYFTCSSLSNDVLLVKGEHRGKNSIFSGNKANDNVITNGSGVVVADGQCVILVDQGKVVDVCTQPGQYTFDSSAQPGFFVGNIGEGFKNVLETVKQRFVTGGIPAQDQRVYYINTKEIFDNKFGTNNPISFRIVDKRIGLDLDASLRCNGVFAFRVVNPIAFYENVAGNVDGAYDRSQLDEQLRTEFISALQPALGKLSALELRPSDLPNHVEELTSALNEVLSQKWTATRGLEITTVALNPITLPEEYQTLIKDAQRAAMYTDPGRAAAMLADAQAQAMRDAAKNPGGVMNGFVGMNMAQQTGGVSAGQLYQQAAASTTKPQNDVTETKQGDEVRYCSHCGAKVSAEAKFCSTCGKALE